MLRARCQSAVPVLFVGLCLVWPVAADAQLDGLSKFKLGGGGGGGRPTVTATLTPTEAKPGEEVTLAIRVELPEGSSTYSQDPSFEKPTVITVSESPGLEPLGEGFTPDRAPERKYDTEFKKELEKYEGTVTWSRKFRLAADAKPEAVYVRGQLSHLVCDETCRPYKDEIAVSLTGGPVPPPRPAGADTTAPAAPPANALAGAMTTATVKYEEVKVPTSKVAGQTVEDPVTLTFRLEPQQAKPGEDVTLTIEMAIGEGWHSFSLKKKPKVGTQTVITLDTLHHLEVQREFTESPDPQLYEGTEYVHFDRVTWTRKLRVTEEGGYGVAGSLKYAICDKSLCKPPKKVAYSLGVVAAAPGGAPVASAASATPTQNATTGAAQSAGQSVEIAPFELAEDAPSESLLMNLLFAFLGGLLLNVMPCVLPVIAIKVLSFVQQAGESRSRILALNGAYTGGVVLVFLSLAGLAVVLGQGWGGLFQNEHFSLFMAAFVFAMGLSLLGVFEIPVPGMVGSAAGGAHREGLFGAFATGIFATLLATPCTGPFMGTTLAWSVKQSAGVVFLIWGVMGFGMASPYLLLGAFPQLVNWLPRPGMWMVRFKEFAGFVLMGAVIWLISSLHANLLIPALVILVGIALGLWMVGNLYDTASTVGHKWRVRALALVLSALVVGFGWKLQYRSTHIEWEKTFSTARIEELRAAGKPILIDFTADWCFNCKTNEAVALDRPETAEFLRQHGITAILADYTDESPEIARWLELSRTEGVPLTLIFPKGRSNRAIPLRGVYTQSQLLEALRDAVGGDRAAQPVEVSTGSTTGTPATIASPAGGAMAK